MIDCHYLEPTTIAEACTLLAEHGDGAKVVAGGQSLALLLRGGQIQPSFLVSIQHIPELECMTVSEEGVKIGAKVALHRLENGDDEPPQLRVLSHVIKEVADPQIRNFATLGGAICEAHPASDITAVLVALNATVKLVSTNGERVVPLHQFVTDAFVTAAQPGELLTEVIVPSFEHPRSASAYRRFALRAGDYPVVSVGAFVSLDGAGQCREARIVVGNCSSTPIRVTVAEARLKSHRITGADPVLAEAGEIAAANVTPLSNPMASSEYKTDLVSVLTREALTAAVALATA